MSAPTPPDPGPTRAGWTAGRKLALFLAITAVASAALGAGAREAVSAAPPDQRAALVVAFAILYAMPPLLVALAIEGALAQAAVVPALALRVRPNRGWALALIVPIALAGAALAVGLAAPGTSLATTPGLYAERQVELRGLEGAEAEAVRAATPDLGASPLRALVVGALSPGGLLFQGLMALPGEVAWRGFVHRMLGGGVWRAGLLTGALWGLWLVPLVALGEGFRAAPVPTAALQVAAGVALGPWLAFVRERAGSVVASALFLAALTRLAGIPALVVLGGDRWLVGQPGLALVGVAVAGWGALALFTRRAAGRA